MNVMLTSWYGCNVDSIGGTVNVNYTVGMDVILTSWYGCNADSIDGMDVMLT